MALPRTEAETLTFGGPDFEPVNSPSWRRARKAGRRRYYQHLARLLDREHERQTIEGRDRKNVFMRRLKRPRRGQYKGAPGKPLNPWRELSRVNRNRRWSVTDKGCRMYWVGQMRSGGPFRRGISVQRVLFAHARRNGEFVLGAPVRDVLGIAPSRVERAVTEARAWWAQQHPEDRVPSAPPPKRRRSPADDPGPDRSRWVARARRQAERYPWLAEWLRPED